MTIERHRIDIEGVVQGVGFRPFAYRLAQQNRLSGWVANHPRGVRLEVEGEAALIDDFVSRLQSDKPLQAVIQKLETMPFAPTYTVGFRIRESITERPPSAPLTSSTRVPADMAPCEDCLRELFDTKNRRYLYPFSNCTACGPRFSIIEQLPYDREHTTLRSFAMCQQCQSEYHNPLDRRFHAEPTACPECGPQLQLCNRHGDTLAQQSDALQQAVTALIEGAVVAVKGVGGFQLLVDATNPAAVKRLRQRKQRPAKPFALLYPDLDSVQQHCHASSLEQQLLLSPQRPIVLLQRREAPDHTRSRVSAAVAPNNPDLGIMLPASPLYYLLSAQTGRPLVATSGNLAGEPICIDNHEALTKLADIADLMLLHDRAIVRPLDDSIVRVINGVATLLRRSRGYTPAALTLPGAQPFSPNLLGLGGQVKNSIALAAGDQVYLSQYLGDLSHRRTLQIFEQSIDDLKAFYGVDPDRLIHDQHPAYASSRWAQSQGSRCMAVQHHTAHFFACLAEHQHNGPALGITWDGTGYSRDGTLRGGEFLCWDGRQQVRHLATLRAFPLPGGEQAIREPRRQALGLLYALRGDQVFQQIPELGQAFNQMEQLNLSRMLSRQLNSPLCSSVGRLFDAVAALLGISSHNEFEGQAAMALEASARRSAVDWHLPFDLINAEPSQCEGLHGRQTIDWGPTIEALLQNRSRGVSVDDCAAAFHNTLAEMIASVTEPLKEYPVFLSGGVFQNRRLTETTSQRLRQHGQRVYIHETVPSNDGGLALGQIYYARCMERAACV